MPDEPETHHIRTAGIVYHGLLPAAEALARSLIERYDEAGTWWMLPADPVVDLIAAAAGAELIITIGGDGTILRGVHAAARQDIPVLGINMGRVGFMSEIDESDALRRVDWYLGNWDHGHRGPRIEKRAMLQATMADTGEGPYHALNDVVIGRGAAVRVIDLYTVLDDVHLATYRGDGLVISTSTGSTGYSLALGGPVMDPGSNAFLLKPIAAHMSLQGGILLRPGAVLQITVESKANCTLSVDGFVDRALEEGETVRVERSTYSARFLRRGQPNAFYRSLMRRLGMRQGAMTRHDRRRAR